MPGANSTLNEIGFQSLQVSPNLAVGVTPPVGERPRRLYIGVSGSAIRWLAVPNREPTGADGHFVGAGGSIDWTNPEQDYAGMISNLKIIAISGTANLEVGFFA